MRKDDRRDDAQSSGGVEYGFAGAVADDGRPALQAVKRWREGDSEREQRLTIAGYGSAAERDADHRELSALMQTEGAEAAMNLAESMAVAGGYLDDGRDDPRLFTEGPPDPFTTIRERALGAPDMDTEPFAPASYPTMYAEWAEAVHRRREANAALEGAAWFEATFDRPERPLLQPLDDTVNYAVIVQAVDPWTSELAVEKYWKLPGGYLGVDGLTLRTFDSDDEAARAQADADRLGLLETYDERGLEGMMHQAELAAMRGGWLDGNRADTRLFRQGPPDRFETLAERLRDEPDPYWNTEGDSPQTPEPGSWDELVARQVDEQPEPERHYWQMHYRPVETPEGVPLGTALFVTEFPGLPPDFDDALPKDAKARALELAHFANDDDARKFEAEFRSYLVPGLLDGPELAPEVAKLEGLCGEWQDMDYRGIVDYMSGDRTVVREESDWHLHNPHAERAARESFDHDPLRDPDL